MVLFKACKRCNGDMVRREDNAGEYLTCVQCGNVVNVDIIRRAVGAIKRGDD